MNFTQSLIFRLSVLLLILVLTACTSVQEKERDEKSKFRIADTNVRLGLGYLKEGRVEAALEKLQKAIAIMPEYAEAQSSIALTYARLGKPEKAEEHYQLAEELKPDDGSIQNNYAVFLCGQKKYSDAEKHFLAAIENQKYRTPAEALENLGVCMLQAHDLDKAEAYLRKALQIDPRLPGALLQMARVSVEKGHTMSGRAYLQRYREVAQLGPEGLWLGIQVEEKLGDKSAARDYETLLRKNFPDSIEMRMLIEKEDEERKAKAKHGAIKQ